MNKGGFSLIEVAVPVAMVLILILAVVAAVYTVSEEKELRERYISLCAIDLQKAEPYMKKSEVLERCEVAWETQVLLADKAKPTNTNTFIYVPH